MFGVRVNRCGYRPDVKGGGKGEIEEDIEVCVFRVWVDSCSVNQAWIYRNSSPGRKDNTFSLGHVAFEVPVRYLVLLALNNISCIKKITWSC